MIIRISHCYLEDKAPRRGTLFCLATARLKEITMRRTILTILGSALLAASTIPIANAAEHDKGRKIYRALAPVTGGFRNSNAYWPAPSAEPDSSRYQNGAESAPAGH